MPHGGLDLLTVSLSLATFSRPELPNELEVLFIVELNLTVVVVFELRMFVHFCWNFLTSEAPDTFNLKIRRFTEDAHFSQGVLSEVIKPLQESFHQVLGLVDHLTFASVFVIVEEPERVAYWIILLLKCIHTTTGFVLVVNHECLEVEEVPGTFWEGFEWVHRLFLLRCFVSSRLWFWFLLLLRLLFGLFTTCSSFFEGWLARFGNDGAFAEDCLE